ncbi:MULTISPECIES: Mor transcription activator family protein [unclassified Massilia]|uniref:Mor transcription activator family protein n=1 Tax=unclassified Massilia TaxID=2609279 RepID=UPI0017833913|nr:MULTISPECIES: Mor transcription activator family protein [unclassified Massilia]MBD8531481.1 helix-turn-helix domain-containing protein [Massilia sp. CFBP 13647]MBD8673723.1 helix-turn-helix domain-containing protein [Massilia sp. CFBP 13721]
MAANTETHVDHQHAAPACGEAVVANEVFSNPDLVDAIFAFIAAEFPDFAPRAAVLKEEVRREFSGIEIYIPQRSIAQRERITKEVLAMFNGRNAAEVARRLNIGRATVYRIIKQDGGKK